MANYNLKAIISVVDKVSGPMRGVVRSLQGPAKALRGVAGASALVGARIGGLLGPLTGLGAIAGTFALGKMISDFTGFGDALAKQALRIGVSVEALQKLRYAGDMAGASQEVLDDALMKANKTLAEAAGGKNKDVADLYRQLGIQMKDSSGQIRSLADIMPELADAFVANENPAVRARMAVALFGRAGQDLIPLLAGGGAAMRDMMAEAERFGLVTKEQAAAAEAFNDAQGRMNAAFTGLRNAIGAELLPRLQPVVDAITDWVAANRQFLATKVDGVVRRVSDALKGIDFTALVEGIDRFLFGYERLLDADGNKVERVAGFFDHLGEAIRIVSNLTAPLVDRFGGAKVALGAVALLVAGPLITSLVTLGMALAGPVGLAVAGIAAAAWLIYDNWDGISAWFAQLWGNVQAVFGGWSEYLTGIFTGDTQRAVAGLKTVWEGLTGYYQTLWDGIAGIFTWAFGLLDGAIRAFLPQPVVDAWDGLLTFFNDLWKDVTAVFDWAWGYIEWIVDKVGGAVDRVAKGIGAVKGLAGDIGDTVVNTASAVGDSISSGASSVGGFLRDGAVSAWDMVAGTSEPAPASQVSPILAAGAQAQQIGGQVDININGLPPGSRVQSDFPRQGPDFNVDAGYRSMAIGAF
ncbi:MAG TPA: phage tail tape measure protein [Kaistia sp.]|nr:phage tail tape measure protein [Kaistia sp.]